MRLIELMEEISLCAKNQGIIKDLDDIFINENENIKKGIHFYFLKGKLRVYIKLIRTLH